MGITTDYNLQGAVCQYCGTRLSTRADKIPRSCLTCRFVYGPRAEAEKCHGEEERREKE